MEDEGLRAMRKLQEATTTVAEFRGTDPLKHVDQMLTSLADVYKSQLADVSVDELVRVQAHLKQTLAIRAAIRGDQSLPVV
jgi:hypothetical protein